MAFGRPLIWNEDISRIAWFGYPPPPPLALTIGGGGGVPVAQPSVVEEVIAENPNVQVVGGQPVVMNMNPTTQAVSGQQMGYQPTMQTTMPIPNAYGQQSQPPVTIAEIYPSRSNRSHSHGRHRSSSRDGSRHHHHSHRR